MKSGKSNMDLKGNSYQWVKTNNPNIYKLETNLSTQNCKIRRDIESNNIEMIELNQGLKFTNRMLIDNKRIDRFVLNLGEITAECKNLI